MRHLAGLLVIVVIAASLRADGPQDNLPDRVRPVPPPGIAVPVAERAELERGIAELGTDLKALRSELTGKPALLELLPDVEVYHKAVDWALRYHEFFNARELPIAKQLLSQGLDRAKQLRGGKPAWTTQTGLVVRGYVSRLDGSVQPYGLVVPPTYQPGLPFKYRLDCWFHGRGETLSELNFIDQRQRLPGEFTPPNTFVLHLYGRYCNANKFAGEIDCLEALEAVKKAYPIDDSRLVARGFSMGGAACWQFAVHYPTLWAAAAPGAGFAETPEFLKVFQREELKPTWFEQKLWHLYDCTDYAINLFNVPTVAYSGELDNQKQAADIMARALETEGIELTHLIGPNTPHRYHPDSKTEINRRIDAIVERGKTAVPTSVRFKTWTLRYNRSHWVTIDRLEQHWERGRVDAAIVDATSVSVTTSGVTALTLAMPSGQCPLDTTHFPGVTIDGHRVTTPAPASDRSWTVHLERLNNGRWTLGLPRSDGSLRKRHGLQGPIDDAFLDSFLIVKPSGPPVNERVAGWVTKEMNRAIEQWRRHFRGDARVKQDREVTEADLAAHNVILWGDPSSNQLIAKIADRLPMRWEAQAVRVGAESYSSAHHVPVLIYPNPLNPKKYVVLNSGFTFREYDYLNNARQVPKLPDWAVVDLTTPPSSRWPGHIANAGFFGENWELRPSAQ